MRTLHGGGTSRKRMHSCGDITGAEIMRTLRDEVQCRPYVNLVEFAPAVELLKDESGRAAGAVLYDLDRDRYLTVRAKATIVSTGGLGRLHLMHFPTTNHYGATADGLAMAYHAGCKLVFLESSQFHPTGAIYPEQIIGLLITEKIRGAGAQFLNVDAEQFVYPLETRDVASSAIIRECAADKNGRGKGVPTPSGRFGVWLDSPLIDLIRGPGTVKRDFPGKYRMYANHGIDIAREPMLIYPTLHYQNGGVVINADASSVDVPGLYFAGEVAGGIHGENRLMGNSLLDVCVFGRRAGAAAATVIPTISLGGFRLDHVKAWDDEVKKAGFADRRAAPILFPDYRGRVM
jgi:succinate dehydrogenase / fumarate reductase flavoprotein subunit